MDYSSISSKTLLVLVLSIISIFYLIVYFQRLPNVLTMNTIKLSPRRNKTQADLPTTHDDDDDDDILLLPDLSRKQFNDSSTAATFNAHDKDDKDNDAHTNVTCDQLMQQQQQQQQRPTSSIYYADGSFLTDKTTKVVWKSRTDGSRELTLPFTCHLKRYTADQALTCLKDKNLLFVGDSLTRYQFMSLAYFLDHKRWPMRFHAWFTTLS